MTDAEIGNSEHRVSGCFPAKQRVRLRNAELGHVDGFDVSSTAVSDSVFSSLP